METFDLWEFIGLTTVLFGGAAFLMGQALAETWRGALWLVPYGIMLAAANHFIDCALFEDDWLDAGHYGLDLIVILAVSLFAFQVTMARKMVRQYPWLYDPAGLFSWKEKQP
ncbi:MAG TPA: hypothetical protein VHL08_10565 [Dongiaceae bacterium]|jgi:branched-chain amino acid transport system ATP-binding protein|nr:hypothetical protein [Dongiaceae bacterium]